MKIKESIAAQSALLWRFMGFFQPPFLRVLHALIVLFVILQLCSSALMGISTSRVSWTGWYHIIAGMGVCVLSVALATYSLRRHGLKYFFPYLRGDTEQIRKDLLVVLRGRMVPPRPGGLAAAVQGLGLGALLLTAFSGLAWFWLWREGWSSAQTLRTLHEWSSFLLIGYFIGHGGMALLHFAFWRKTAVKR